MISSTFDPSFATLFRTVLTNQRGPVVKISIALVADTHEDRTRVAGLIFPTPKLRASTPPVPG